MYVCMFNLVNIRPVLPTCYTSTLYGQWVYAKFGEATDKGNGLKNDQDQSAFAGDAEPSLKRSRLSTISSDSSATLTIAVPSLPPSYTPAPSSSNQISCSQSQIQQQPDEHVVGTGEDHLHLLLRAMASAAESKQDHISPPAPPQRPSPTHLLSNAQACGNCDVVGCRSSSFETITLANRRTKRVCQEHFNMMVRCLS